MDRYDWIIGICNTSVEEVNLYRFYGSEEEAKEKLLSLIKEDKFLDNKNWDYGCESVEDIHDEYNGNEFGGYNCFYEYSIHYTAKKFAHVETI